MSKLQLFSEMPCDIAMKDYEKIEMIAGLSEKYNYDGSLIYYFHNSLDPWIVLTKVLQCSSYLNPLVAVQPYSVQPFTVAKMIKSIAALYGRKINLNLITGVNDHELKSAGEILDPKKKYARLSEYIEIMKKLLQSDEPFSYSGEYYSYKNLTNYSQIEEEVFPGLFIPGSSDESIGLVHQHEGTAVLRPEPIELFRQNYLSKIALNRANVALRIAMIARPDSSEAWSIAREKFPDTGLGRMTLMMRRKISSHNTQMMLRLEEDLYDGVFWMGAYKSGSSLDPYFIGSYQEVADYLQLYLDSGVNALLLGQLEDEEDYYHVNEVIKRLVKR